MSATDLDAGMALLQAGRWAEGTARLQAVLEREPQFAEVWSNLGFALREQERRDEAAAALERAVALKPALADAWNLLGLVRHEQGRRDEAIAAFDRALALRPDFAFAWMNRANSAQARGDTAAALADYARALALAPSHAPIHYNLGHLRHKALGDLAAAEGHYRDAIRLDGRHAMAHLNLSHLLLLQGRLEEGWREFGWRSQRAVHAQRAGRPYAPPALAPWPASLDVRAEQGLGDVLFFLRWAPLAAARGSRLAFAGDARLHPLLRRTGLFESLAGGDAPPRADAAEVLVGDLPLLFEAGAMPPPLPLAPDAAARERVAARLPRAPGRLIALTWRAGEKHEGLFGTLFKELAPAQLGAALRGIEATWVSVQRDPRPGEREALAAALGAPVHDGAGVNADLDEALAAMDLADEYVGVSNTNAHLRAGLGKPMRVLVPFPPEWRWAAAGVSPWFPANAVYRQQAGGRWDAALAALRRDLAAQ